ncbi:hypothetical protein Tco_0412419 [Tanacetum coccineum]
MEINFNQIEEPISIKTVEVTSTKDKFTTSHLSPPSFYQAPTHQMQGVSKTDFENYIKANDDVLRNMQNQGQGTFDARVPHPLFQLPKRPRTKPETSMDKVQKPSLENTAQVPPPEDHDSIFIEIPKPKAKKIVQEPNAP